MSQQLVASVPFSVRDDKESLLVATALLHLNLAVGPAGYSRLRGVEGVRAVPHILGAVENTESQTGKEVTRGQITSHWPDGESCAL